MFFMMGITNGQKELEHQQMVICGECGRYGHYTVFMTYMVLSIFFIPILKWNRKYYVRTSCCNALYQLNPEVGKRIARGEQIEIRKEDLERVNEYGQQVRMHRCANCGFTTAEDFEYCPKCGTKF
jgi:hypothetical protein